jgi:23S rRNA (cytosine1962-C5)-methyltransferase
LLNLPIYTSQEYKRLYHGRGEKTYPFLTIDSIEDSILIEFYEEKDEKPFLEYLKKYVQNTHHKNIIVKRRYKNETVAFLGKIPDNAYAIENGIKFKLNFHNQNIGYFGDMKYGRSFIEKISKNKSVLNLFAYTCGFSLFAKRGGAKFIANVDMSKSALSTGMKNHKINSLDTNGVSFWPYNILKAFPKLKKKAPYDIIIIDPPSFQKGSFIAKKDYEKIIKKLSFISHKNTLLLACINSPQFTKDQLIRTIETFSEFRFEKQLKNPEEYTNSTLKSLVFNIR